jgi:hypothetical protein
MYNTRGNLLPAKIKRNDSKKMKMSLKGKLSDFSPAQLLNLIKLARRTGALTIEGEKGTIKIYFKEGKLTYASLVGQDRCLTDLLIKSGKITQEQSRAIEAHSEVKTEKELALLLLNAGYITQNDLLQIVEEEVLNIACFLFTWTEGGFRFEPDVLPPDDRISVLIPLEEVIGECNRYVEEWNRLRDELPNLEMSLRFADISGLGLHDIRLTPEEWQVIRFANSSKTIEQIAQFNAMSDFQIRRIVCGLIRSGLVELVKPESIEVVALPEQERQLAKKLRNFLQLIEKFKKS